MERLIIFDTETTGLNAKIDRIVEIGCVEVIDRRITDKTFHVYINPQMQMSEEVIKIHGITNEFVQDKPKFIEIADDFYSFIQGGILIAHNLSFDMKFLEEEFLRIGKKHESAFYRNFQTLDTLQLAKEKRPGKRNNLDALCRDYDVDNSSREFHGALLDAQLLAQVYLKLTGGQIDLLHSSNTESENLKNTNNKKENTKYKINRNPLVILADEHEIKLHESYILENKISWDV